MYASNVGRTMFDRTCHALGGSDAPAGIGSVMVALLLSRQARRGVNSPDPCLFRRQPTPDRDAEPCCPVSARRGQSRRQSVGNLADSAGLGPTGRNRNRPVRAESGAPGRNRTCDSGPAIGCCRPESAVLGCLQDIPRFAHSLTSVPVAPVRGRRLASAVQMEYTCAPVTAEAP